MSKNIWRVRDLCDSGTHMSRDSSEILPELVHDPADRKRGQWKGATSKIVTKCQKYFSTLFDIFRAGQKKTSKIVKNDFRHFLAVFARHRFSGPFWVALVNPGRIPETGTALSSFLKEKQGASSPLGLKGAHVYLMQRCECMKHSMQVGSDLALEVRRVGGVRVLVSDLIPRTETLEQGVSAKDLAKKE